MRRQTVSVSAVNLLCQKRKKHTLSETLDPDEMQHNAAFHLGLHCL